MIAILATGLADLATFLAFKQFHIFEVNPAWILTKSIVFMIALKIGVLLYASFWLIRGLRTNTLSYMVVLCAVYIILFQALGVYLNLHTVATNPAPSQALPPQKAVNTYLQVMLVNYAMPILLATLAYWIFDKCGYDARTTTTSEVQKDGTIQKTE